MKSMARGIETMHLLMFIPVVLLLVFLAFNYSKMQGNNGPLPDSNSQKKQPENSLVAECLYECCEEGAYQKKSCALGKECKQNKCQQAACPFECCDDESSTAKYTPKACDSNMLCEGDKCVPRPCWTDCCTGRPGYEEKPCDSNLICNAGICEKPECPDKYKCCPENDSEYKEKKCTGNNVCKFRFCKAP